MTESFTEKEIEAVNGFLSRYKGSTLKMYTSDLDMLFDWLLERKHIRMLKVKPIDLEHFGRYLEEERKNKASSVNRRLVVIRRFYTYAHGTGLIKMNPAVALRIPKIHRQDENRFGLNRLQMSILLNFAIERSPKDGTLVALLMVMGLRVTTALSFNVGDLDRVENGHRVFRYMTKFNKIGTVPIPVPVARVIDKLAEGRDPREPLITTRTGRRMTRNDAYKRLKTIAKLAGLPYENIHPHTLRGSAITAALDSGMPIRDVQRFADHADVSMTLRYDHGNNNLDTHPVYMLSGLIGS